MTADNTYGVSEIVGSSETSIDDAIRQAITKASENRRHIRWFEVKEVRGHVEGSQVAHFQVTLKLGYSLED
ncbi:MAG: dodecin domain-containing protein [Phenylobacterium sp.]|uniref:dodecin n=1 Tax=Phenylobacterium sp. TaxID=1871053 RepID=UPI001A54E77C|nr:dodecin [Phenylobacterium sp.]MBL8772108.1 dodecin domain-containing protein [Phenylobacterium sp.]